MTIVVPGGAEASSVRRTVPDAIVVPAGAASAELPAIDADRVVVVGLCGALRELPCGTVVVYRRIIGPGDMIELDAEIAGALLGALPGSVAVQAFTGDGVVTTRDARSALAARYHADVVDMEGAHVARALAARGIRYGMARVVSDDARFDLPPIDDAIGPDGRVRPLRIAFAFARAPRAALRFVRDVRAALVALRDVARLSATVC